MELTKKRNIRRAAKYLILFIILMIASKKLTDKLDDKEAFLLASVGAVTFAIVDILSPSVSK